MHSYKLVRLVRERQSLSSLGHKIFYSCYSADTNSSLGGYQPRLRIQIDYQINLCRLSQVTQCSFGRRINECPTPVLNISRYIQQCFGLLQLCQLSVL